MKPSQSTSPPATSPPAITTAQPNSPQFNLRKRPKCDKIYRNLNWNIEALEEDKGVLFDWVTLLH